MTRKVIKVLKADEIMMGPNRLRQAIPARGLEQVSPFILLHHFDFNMEPGKSSFEVPPHPHRGFCPITFMFEGAIQHTDSLGNDEVIIDNEVQWINAARGIIHAEKPGKEFIETGGRFQGIQLWVNLPRAEKMKTPTYQAITAKEIPLVDKDGVAFRLISGTYGDLKGPAKSDVFTATMRMQAGSHYTVSLPGNENMLVYVLEGDVAINGESKVSRHDLVIFENADGAVTLQASTNAKLLLMAGKPIDEPKVAHGPFVMTSETEIMEAMRDYQQGRMGFLY